MLAHWPCWGPKGSEVFAVPFGSKAEPLCDRQLVREYSSFWLRGRCRRATLGLTCCGTDIVVIHGGG